jgi:hypothetical protein
VSRRTRRLGRDCRIAKEIVEIVHAARVSKLSTQRGRVWVLMLYEPLLHLNFSVFSYTQLVPVFTRNIVLTFVVDLSRARIAGASTSVSRRTRRLGRDCRIAKEIVEIVHAARLRLGTTGRSRRLQGRADRWTHRWGE